MKHLIIIGPGRCGKTALSNLCTRKLATKYNVHLFVGDFLRYAYLQTFKKHWQYKFFWRPIKSVFPKFGKRMVERVLPRPDLAHLIHEYMFAGTYPISTQVGVFEMAFRPKDAIAIFPEDTFKIVLVATPNLTPQEKFEIMKKTDKTGWNGLLSDDNMMKIAVMVIKQSKEMVAQAKELGITIVDTSYDYHGELKKFADNIEEFLK